MEPYYGIKAVHALNHLIAVLIPDNLIRHDLEGLADIGNGDGEDGAAYRHPHAIHDSHGKRDLHGKGSAVAFLAV